MLGVDLVNVKITFTSLFQLLVKGTLFDSRKGLVKVTFTSPLGIHIGPIPNTVMLLKVYFHRDIFF